MMTYLHGRAEGSGQEDNWAHSSPPSEPRDSSGLEEHLEDGLLAGPRPSTLSSKLN